MGCGTVPGPGYEPVQARIACGPLAENYCAPNVGDSNPLRDKPGSITLDLEGNPRVLEYLGTIIPIDGAPGIRGANCGNTGQTPFRVDDIEPDYDNQIEQNVRAFRTSSGKISADIVAAMRVAGVPRETIEGMEAEVEAAVDSIGSLTVRATGNFRQYQIRASILRNLESSEPDARLERCLDDIRTGKWRLYQAITGWQVDIAEVNQRSTRGIVAELVGRVSSESLSVDIANLESSLNNIIYNQLSTSAGPHFILLGVSFWEPVRLAPALEGDQ